MKIPCWGAQRVIDQYSDHKLITENTDPVKAYSDYIISVVYYRNVQKSAGVKDSFLQYPNLTIGDFEDYIWFLKEEDEEF